MFTRYGLLSVNLVPNSETMAVRLYRPKCRCRYGVSQSRFCEFFRLALREFLYLFLKSRPCSVIGGRLRGELLAVFENSVRRGIYFFSLVLSESHLKASARPVPSVAIVGSTLHSLSLILLSWSLSVISCGVIAAVTNSTG